jgi:hypothetical protein
MNRLFKKKQQKRKGMKKVYYLITLTVVLLISSGCTNMKVSALDPATGYLPTTQKATVVKSTPFAIDDLRTMILVPTDPFLKNQTIAIGYFHKVIDFNELEKAIIQNDLSDTIPSIQNRIGLSKVYDEYLPFLWLRISARRQGTSQYAQIILTDPDSMEEIFVAERYIDYLWTGVNDQYIWYPLFNSLIDYIKENSEIWNSGA